MRAPEFPQGDGKTIPNRLIGSVFRWGPRQFFVYRPGETEPFASARSASEAVTMLHYPTRTEGA
jgi:hypothetical protein